MRALLLSFALFPATLAAAPQNTDHAGKPHSSSLQAVNAFRPTAWVPLGEAPAARPKLDLAPPGDEVEDLTVYGKRIHPQDQNPAPAPLTLGPATLSGTTRSERPGFSGLTITAAVPVPGVSGLDATLDISGGHDQVNPTTTAVSAAAIAGLKLKF